MIRRDVQRPPAAAVLGIVAFLLIGWTGLLVPSLIRSIEQDFAQNDAGIGIFFLLNAVAYVAGSMGGGALTERLGRRWVLAAAAFLLGCALVMLSLAPVWLVFLLAAVPLGLGAGGIDGGVNGLFLDLYATARGRALNGLHLFFSLGALTAPLFVGRLVDLGVPWQTVMVSASLVAIPLAACLALAPMPSGRNAMSPADQGGWRRGLPLPLVALAVAIACYVASEIGVSNWLVRFLDAAPLGLATSTLSLYWAGLTLGRLVSARFSDGFDHRRLAIASTLGASIALVAAVLVPWLPASVVLFGLVGFASGPIYPLIMAIAGDRFPDRAAAVSGLLSGAAVVGSVIYPPVMGFLSVTVGLTVAMLGTALLGFACAATLSQAGRLPRGDASVLRSEAG